MIKKAVGISIATLSLMACANEDMAQYIEEIEEASEAFSEVDNGRFSITDTVHREEERAETETNGVFVRTDEGADWQTVMAIEGADGEAGTKTERVSIDSTTYERFGRVDEEGKYIDPEGEMVDDFGWLEMGEEVQFPLSPLLDMDFDASFIDGITKEEREEKVVYTIDYTEEFLEQQKEENLSDLQTELESLEEANMGEPALQALEQNITYHEELSYESMGLEVAVDHNGVLVEYIIETQVDESITMQPESEPSRLVTTNKIELLEYNDPTITVTMDELE